MSRLLYRIGRAAALRPWVTIGLWLAVLVTMLGLAITWGGTPNDNYRIPDSSSQRANDMLTEKFPDRAGAEARLVVRAPSGTLSEDTLNATAERLKALPNAAVVEPPVLSEDGRTAILTVLYDVPVTGLDPVADIDALERAGQPLRDAGTQVELGGQFPENSAAPSGVAEGIGILAALVILLVAFGSVVAAGLPLALALLGIGIGTAGITLYAATTDLSTVGPILATMVGLGVGVDYALFVVSRHREGLVAGTEMYESIGQSNAKAGRSVVFAGFTVLLALAGLQFSGLPNFSSIGYATGIVVAATVLLTVTLLPALLGLAKMRVFSRHARRRGIGVSTRPNRPPLAEAWARRVSRRPLVWALGATALLLLLAAPTLSIRLSQFDAGAESTSSTTRRAYDLVADGFGAGANGPLVIAVDLEQVPETSLEGLRTTIGQAEGVAQVSPVTLAPDNGAAVITVVPESGPQDERTTDLVNTLRTDVLPTGADVTGPTAVYVDLSQRLSDNLPLVIAVVLSLSFVLLVIVFRSILVPLKAVVMNLLSVAAAYGVVTAVFQWGWGAQLFGLDGTVPVSSFVPLLMFVISFGLSMDYEVFLLSRIREQWAATGDSRGSVIFGLSSTGRVITSAAAIMVAVFLGFAADPALIVKMIGVGLATAILVDATIVRLVLVPAVMTLFGSAAWWFPGRGASPHGPPAPPEPELVAVPAEPSRVPSG